MTDRSRGTPVGSCTCAMAKSSIDAAWRPRRDVAWQLRALAPSLRPYDRRWIDRADLLAGRHLALGDRGVAVIPGNIARLVAPNVTAAIGKLVTLRIGGAVRLGSTRVGGSGTPRDYPVTIVGVFDEAASQTSVRIPLEDALVAGADNRGLTADSLRQQTGYSGIAIEADDSTNVAEIVRSVQELGYSSFSLKQVVEQIDQGFGVFRG